MKQEERSGVGRLALTRLAGLVLLVIVLFVCVREIGNSRRNNGQQQPVAQLDPIEVPDGPLATGFDRPTFPTDGSTFQGSGFSLTIVDPQDPRQTNGPDFIVGSVEWAGPPLGLGEDPCLGEFDVQSVTLLGGGFPQGPDSEIWLPPFGFPEIADGNEDPPCGQTIGFSFALTDGARSATQLTMSWSLEARPDVDVQLCREEEGEEKRYVMTILSARPSFMENGADTVLYWDGAKLEKWSFDVEQSGNAQLRICHEDEDEEWGLSVCEEVELDWDCEPGDDDECEVLQLQPVDHWIPPPLGGIDCP